MSNTTKRKKKEQNLEKQKLEKELLTKLYLSFDGGLKLGDLSWDGKSYRNCFIAQEFIDWLVQNKEHTRQSAVEFGQLLIENNIVSFLFKDDNNKLFADLNLFMKLLIPLDNISKKNSEPETGIRKYHKKSASVATETKVEPNPKYMIRTHSSKKDLKFVPPPLLRRSSSYGDNMDSNSSENADETTTARTHTQVLNASTSSNSNSKDKKLKKRRPSQMELKPKKSRSSKWPLTSREVSSKETGQSNKENVENAPETPRGKSPIILKTQKMEVRGDTIVDWLLSENIGTDRKEAISIGNRLAKYKIISPVDNGVFSFRDSNIVYNYISFVDPSRKIEKKKSKKVNSRKSSSIETFITIPKSSNTSFETESTQDSPNCSERSSISQKFFSSSQLPSFSPSPKPYRRRLSDSDFRKSIEEDIVSKTPAAPNYNFKTPPMLKRSSSLGSMVIDNPKEFFSYTTDAKKTAVARLMKGLKNLKMDQSPLSLPKGIRSDLTENLSLPSLPPIPLMKTSKKSKKKKTNKRLAVPGADALRMTLVLDLFIVHVGEEDLSFFYNPDQKLCSIIKKINTTTGLDPKDYSPCDANGNHLDVNLTLRELNTRHIVYCPRSNTDVDLVQSTPSRMVVFRHRNLVEIDSISTPKQQDEFKSKLKLATKKKKQIATCFRPTQPSNGILTLWPLPTSKIALDYAFVEQIEGQNILVAASIEVMIEIMIFSAADEGYEATLAIAFDAFVESQTFISRLMHYWKESDFSKKNILNFLIMLLTLRADLMGEKTIRGKLELWSENMDAEDHETLAKMHDFKDFLGVSLRNHKEDYSIPAVLASPKDISTSKVDIFDFKPIEVAQQLALLGHHLLSKISPCEWHQQGWLKGKSPHIVSAIHHFNQISLLVQTLLVLGQTIQIRVLVINHFLLIAMECLALNDYSSVMAIVSGLTATPCSRLAQTWAGVEASAMKSLEYLKDLISITNRSKNLRDAQENTNSPTVPYIGVYLNDLTLIDEANQNTLSHNEKTLVNFEKWRMVAKIILKIESYKMNPYNLRTNYLIREYLKNLTVLEEDELFEESKKREGRIKVLKNL